MNTTPCPTKTSSSIVTPSQMKVWLEILQRAPIEAFFWTSTKRPDAGLVADLAAVEVNETVHDYILPRRTSGETRMKLAGSIRSCVGERHW